MDGGVPADDELTSLTPCGEGPGGPDWPVAFTTTRWSVVLTAQDESPAAYEALEKLCRIYWRPIYSFAQRQGLGPEEAKDITQGFLRSYWNAKFQCRAQGKRTTSLFSARGAKILSGRRAPSRKRD